MTTVVLSAGGLFLLVDRGDGTADRPGGQAKPAPVALGNNEPIMMAPDATSASISITLSQAAYPDGSADAAILTRDDTWAYAIATGGIQGVLGGPLLLTSSERLSPGILDELRRVGAEKVYLMGSETALAPAVARVLTGAGYQVERIGGANPIETSLAAAQRLMPGAQTAVLLGGGRTLPNDRGRGAVDALAAGSWAAMHDVPVLLTDPFTLSSATREYIRRSRITDVVIVGGTMAVAAPVKEELERLGVRVERVGGENRYDTAAQLVELWGAHNGFLLIDGSTERLSAAGFAAAAYSMRANAPVLLANSGSLPPETGRMLNGLRQPVQLICAPGVEKDPCMTAQELSLAIRGG
ncbi:MAG: cell wall-binding repeat-containing protein [Egibacteraceae bacterium]